MAFRGWISLTVDGQTVEVANSSRVVDHLTAPSLSTDPGAGCGCTAQVQYDDSWPGLRAWLGDGAGRYEIPDAPWYSASVPASAEFAGVWVMGVEGLDATPVEREVTELIGRGGMAAPHRDPSRPITVTALVVGCTNAGARFGLSWLSRALRQTRGPGGGRLDFLAAHPSGTGTEPEALRRESHGVVLTAAPTVVDVSGMGGGAEHRQASVMRVEWEMIATNPLVYRPVIEDREPSQDGGWKLIPIEWVHEAECTDPTGADLPVLFAPGCEPAQVTVPAAPVPQCGGCLPVCGLNRTRYQVVQPSDSFGTGAVSLQLTWPGSRPDPMSATIYLRPIGSTDPTLEVGHTQISGLPPGGTLVLDAITGRPTITIDGILRQHTGIVTTPSGAPWTPLVLDHHPDGWEMVWEAQTQDLPDPAVTVHEIEG